MSDEIKPRFDPGNDSEDPKIIGEHFLRAISSLLAKGCDHNDTNNVVNRLRDMGWLDGDSLVKKDGAAISLSPKGKQKMTEFIDLCMTAKQDPNDAQFGFGSVLSLANNEFNPPLTSGESSALSALLMEYFIKFKWQKLPPPTPPPI